MAKDHVGETYQLLGGYFSPVSDAYLKPGLSSGVDRVRMCQLALQHSSWLMVDGRCMGIDSMFFSANCSSAGSFSRNVKWRQNDQAN